MNQTKNETVLTEKEIKLKGGGVLKAGLPVKFPRETLSICLVTSPDHAEPVRVRVQSAFTCPSAEELEEALSEGVCPTVAGESAECDGHDHYGSPSWLLALGMI